MINDSALYGIARTHFPNVSVLESNAGLSTVKVYPNPANAILNLKTEKESEKIISYSLYSIQGILLNSKESLKDNQTEVDLTNSSNGMYLIRVNTSNGISNFKVIKE